MRSVLDVDCSPGEAEPAQPEVFKTKYMATLVQADVSLVVEGLVEVPEGSVRLPVYSMTA